MFSTVWSASRTQCASRSWLASRLWCLSGYWCLCRFGTHFIDNKLTPYGSNFLRPLNCRFVPPRLHIGHAAGEVPLRSPQVTHLIVRFGYAFVPTTNTGPFVRPRLHIRSPMLVIDFSSSLFSPSYPPGYTSDRLFWPRELPADIGAILSEENWTRRAPLFLKKIGPNGLAFRAEDSKAFTTCLSYPAGYTFDLAVRVFAYALTYSASYRHDRLCSLAIFNPISHPSMIPLSKPYSLTRFFDSFLSLGHCVRPLLPLLLCPVDEGELEKPNRSCCTRKAIHVCTLRVPPSWLHAVRM